MLIFHQIEGNLKIVPKYKVAVDLREINSANAKTLIANCSSTDKVVLLTSHCAIFGKFISLYHLQCYSRRHSIVT